MSAPELIAGVLALGSLAYVLAPLVSRRGVEHAPTIPAVCPACGAASPRGARFCANCGGPLTGTHE
jgi:hypothetical protein